jgi:NTP pyrophosphatase (non-canonical NTP hydrolase)
MENGLKHVCLIFNSATHRAFSTFNFQLSISSTIQTKTMTIKDAQTQVDNWIKTVGVRYFNELTNLGILMEEVGELSRLMVRTYGEQSFKESDKNKNIADEMADVLWVLICLANQTGVDLTEALEKNFEKKNIRDAERHKGNEKLR